MDVKATETDAPWFLKVANLVGLGNPTINAHARVSLKTETTGGGFLPIALPVSDPKLGQVTFVNEATNAVLATAPLTRDGAANGTAVWDNATQPITLPVGVGVSNIGVNVTLSGSNSVTCGAALVQCYTGINFVHGYVPQATPPNGTQPNPPVLRDVSLTPGTCANAYFTSTSCTIGVSAQVDIGGLAPANASMAAVVGGTTYNLTYNAGAGRWLTTGAPITVAPGTGQHAVTITWFENSGTVNGQTCTNNKNKNPCQGTFAGTAHRTYGAINASNGSGPIQTMQILQGAGVSNQSFAQGTSQTGIVVQIGVQDVLELAKASDPPVQLRVVVGSQNQSVDCDPGISNLEGELRGGMRAHLRPKRRFAVVPELTVRALGHGAAVVLRCDADRRRDQPDSQRPQRTHPGSAQAQLVHLAQPLAQLCARRSAGRADLRDAVRVIRRAGKHDGAGDALRGLLHHRLDRAGAGVQQPLPGKRRRPGARRGNHRRPLHPVHRHRQQRHRRWNVRSQRRGLMHPRDDAIAVTNRTMKER